MSVISIQPTSSASRMEYFFAMKPEHSEKWIIRNKRFVLNSGEHLFGEYLTTIWFNQLIREEDNQSYDFMIIKVDSETDSRQRRRIVYQINYNRNYINIPNVFLYGRISEKKIKEIKKKVSLTLSKEMYSMAAIPVHCDLVIGDKNRDELIITIQGSYKKNTIETCCDEPEIIYSFTLPMFRTAI